MTLGAGIMDIHVVMPHGDVGAQPAERIAGVPNLRLILADALYFAISLLAAMAWIAAISAMIAIVIAPFFFICKYLFQIVLNCTP